jgi:hypothetical protein
MRGDVGRVQARVLPSNTFPEVQLRELMGIILHGEGPLRERGCRLLAALLPVSPQGLTAPQAHAVFSALWYAVWAPPSICLYPFSVSPPPSLSPPLHSSGLNPVSSRSPLSRSFPPSLCLCVYVCVCVCVCVFRVCEHCRNFACTRHGNLCGKYFSGLSFEELDVRIQSIMGGAVLRGMGCMRMRMKRGAPLWHRFR